MYRYIYRSIGVHELESVLNQFAQQGWRLHTIEYYDSLRLAHIVMEGEVAPEPEPDDSSVGIKMVG